MVKSLIRIFANKILQMAYNEASLMMLTSKFPRTKFSLVVDHSRKLQNFNTAKISGYTVYVSVYVCVCVCVCVCVSVFDKVLWRTKWRRKVLIGPVV